MPRPTSKATDPWAALDAIVKREQEPVGPEWFTIDQFSERYQLSNKTSREKCCQLHKEGKLKRWTGFSPAYKRIIVKYSLT